MIINFTCPVCAFSGMDEPPEDHSICACCGTHFGYHDVSKSHRFLRNLWLRDGGEWFDQDDAAYPGLQWNAWSQVASAGLPFDVPEPVRYTYTYNRMKFGVMAEVA